MSCKNCNDCENNKYICGNANSNSNIDYSKYYIDSASTCSSSANNAFNSEILETIKQSKKLMIPVIKNYIEDLENKTVIVEFASDGTKTHATCSDGDTYDLVTGIEQCILKKLCGTDVKSQIKAVIKSRENYKKMLADQEKAKKEAKIAEANRKKKNAEKKMRMKARYEAKLAIMIEEEKNNAKKRVKLNEAK